jgi:hypothetical protein
MSYFGCPVYNPGEHAKIVEVWPTVREQLYMAALQHCRCHLDVNLSTSKVVIKLEAHIILSNTKKGEYSVPGICSIYWIPFVGIQ